jgi:hypothetical protein
MRNRKEMPDFQNHMKVCEKLLPLNLQNRNIPSYLMQTADPTDKLIPNYPSPLLFHTHHDLASYYQTTTIEYLR